MNKMEAISDFLLKMFKILLKTDKNTDIKVLSMFNEHNILILVGNISMSSLIHKIIALLCTTSPYFIDSVLC